MDYAKTSKRLSAYLLDTLLVYLLISLIISIRFINPTYEKYINSYKNYEKVLEKYYNEEISSEELINQNKDNLYYITKYSISTNIVVIVVLIGYNVFFQKYNNNQTLGKKIMKIKVTSTNDKEISLLRYFIRLLPMYLILVGNILQVLLNTIIVFITNKNNYIYINSIISYIFLGIAIITFVMISIGKDKKGIHDYLAKTIVVNDK